MNFKIEKGFSITRGDRIGQSFNVYIKGATKYYTIERYEDGGFMNMNCWYVRGEGIMQETCMRSCKENSMAWNQVTKAVNKII